MLSLTDELSNTLFQRSFFMYIYFKLKKPKNYVVKKNRKSAQ